MTLEFRVLTTADELAVMPDFEGFIWGGDEDRVSVNVLAAVVHEGGLALAAFEDERVVASAFAFPTHEPGVLHSHYMAVHPDRRGTGIGEQMKRAQAVWCRDHGYHAMRWTFDPLQLTNAHLNLNKLGALGVEYHVNLYGALGGINGSLPSDRLTVQWELVAPRPDLRESFVLSVPPVSPDEIAASRPEAFAARMAIRDEMAPHLTDGWVVAAVDRLARTYTLAR
ncbi:MAG: hypothetical protein RJA49_2039 [Actinomycetota bacterium]